VCVYTRISQCTLAGSVCYTFHWSRVITFWGFLWPDKQSTSGCKRFVSTLSQYERGHAYTHCIYSSSFINFGYVAQPQHVLNAVNDKIFGQNVWIMLPVKKLTIKIKMMMNTYILHMFCTYNMFHSLLCTHIAHTRCTSSI